MCSLALPHTPLTGSMSCCLGIGRLFNSKALRCRRLDGARQQISHVFTLGHVAEILGEDEDWLFDVAEEMDTEDGQLWVVGFGEDGVMAFTDDGIENLKNLIAIHNDDASIIEERRQALATMIKPKTEESDEV
jgi:hypothetical protein